MGSGRSSKNKTKKNALGSEGFGDAEASLKAKRKMFLMLAKARRRGVCLRCRFALQKMEEKRATKGYSQRQPSRCCRIKMLSATGLIRIGPGARTKLFQRSVGGIMSRRGPAEPRARKQERLEVCSSSSCP